jgi:polyhydroxybutyrate depolymerase
VEPTSVKGRRRVIAAVLALLWLPPLAALGGAVAFHVRNANNRSLVSSGERREYLLHVPRSYDPGRATPLVISMHGGGGYPTQQRDISKWNETADEHGFLVAYPSGVGGRGSRGWRLSNAGALAKDVRFIADLIGELETAYNIDPQRIYADGLSNGGGMAFVLSCALSGRIAAVGMVASAQLLPFDWCADERPVPMIAFHGTGDSIVPYRGGRTRVADVTFPSIEAWVASWARRNRCGLDAAASQVAADASRRVYSGCADDADVVLFTIHGGGHTWPGGLQLPAWFLGPTSRSIDATKLTWAFFREHPLTTR